MGAKCYPHDEYMDSLIDSVIAMWEDKFPSMTPEELRPITMVMYCAALIPLGMYVLSIGVDLL